MKKAAFILIAVLLLVSLVACMAACGDDEETPETTAAPQGTETTAAATGDAVVLRFTVPHPAGDPVTENFQKEFVDKFNAQAGGKYIIELHPNGALRVGAR